MSTLSTVYQFLLGWMPAQIAQVLLGLIALTVVLMVFHIIKVILDSLPFV